MSRRYRRLSLYYALDLLVVNVAHQTEPTSTVKALYDYEAVSPGEVSITEGEALSVYEKDDDWILVKCERDGGKVGYVPANYVEEVRFQKAFIFVLSSGKYLSLGVRNRLRPTRLISSFQTL
jgi:SH3 domain